jgi:hypothetical protein
MIGESIRIWKETLEAYLKVVSCAPAESAADQLNP